MITSTRYAFALCILVLLPAPAAVLYAADAPPAVLGTAGDLALETGAFMKETAHAGHRSPPADWQTQSGALRMNANWETDHALRWFIEDQQLGGDYVAAGLALGNPDQTRWGLKVLQWGFAHMEDDGLFRHPDCYHSASFFIEASAHALLLMEASAGRAEFIQQTQALKPKVLTAARWMTRADVRARAWDDPSPKDSTLPRCPSERPYGHRRYLDAAALGEAGVLCHDRELIEKSAAFIRDGIAFQRPDGANPEKGGADHHYQALGLLYACRYYRIVADDALRAEMRPMLDKAFAWLAARVKPDGSIDATGNARTGFGQEKARNGKPKGLEYRFTALSLAQWAQLTHNAALESTARRVFAADLQMRARGVEMTWDGY